MCVIKVLSWCVEPKQKWCLLIITPNILPYWACTCSHKSHHNHRIVSVSLLWLIHRAGLVRGGEEHGITEHRDHNRACSGGMGWEAIQHGQRKRWQETTDEEVEVKAPLNFRFQTTPILQKGTNRKKIKWGNEVNQSKERSLNIGEDHGKCHEGGYIPIVNM